MRRTFCFRVSGFTSPSTGQALPADAAKHFVGAHGVVAAEAGTGGMAEVELGEVALEVRFGHVEGPHDAALRMEK